MILSFLRTVDRSLGVGMVMYDAKKGEISFKMFSLASSKVYGRSSVRYTERIENHNPQKISRNFTFFCTCPKKKAGKRLTVQFTTGPRPKKKWRERKLQFASWKRRERKLQFNSPTKCRRSFYKQSKLGQNKNSWAPNETELLKNLRCISHRNKPPAWVPCCVMSVESSAREEQRTWNDTLAARNQVCLP